jgi:hypothetical protein
MNWPDQIEASLGRLGAFLRDTPWYGRENELVNLFAHQFLASDRVHPAQIGIEVAVKQLEREGGKALVRKDLVVWNSPNETVWVNGHPTNDPAVVIEFKVNDHKKCAPDIQWLVDYTLKYPSVLGYSVCGFLKDYRGVSFIRISKGAKHKVVGAPEDVLPRVSQGNLSSDYIKLAKCTRVVRFGPK